jgi:hypothetical protein
VVLWERVTEAYSSRVGVALHRLQPMAVSSRMRTIGAVPVTKGRQHQHGHRALTAPSPVGAVVTMIRSACLTDASQGGIAIDRPTFQGRLALYLTTPMFE